jgi:neurotransmitter:Na+ symporter, NSS family
MTVQWKSSTSFVLATVGAAVGLGNIWRFSYVAGENGGAAFLLIYLFFVLVIGLPLVIAELALGRNSSGDAVSALDIQEVRGFWRRLGWIGVISAALIASYYAVIAGWALKYLFGALTGQLWESAGQGYGLYFESFIAAGLEPVLWQGAILVLTALVVVRGLKDGIERINVILMPLLMLIVLAMAGYAMTLPGSEGGISFLLKPDWSAFSRPGVYLTALGQAFFSLGLGVAVFVTYGGYLSRATSIPSSAAAVVLGDTAFALVAGIAIFGTVFALGGDPAAGPKLAFVTFPQLLLELPGGRWIGIVFFFLLTAAALTSMVALLEVPAAAAINRLGWSREKAVVILSAALFVLGLPLALSYGPLAGLAWNGTPLLDAVDQAVSNFLLPASGLVIALVVGWRIKRHHALATADLAPNRLGTAWLWSIRFIAPATVLLILAQSLRVF